MAAPIANVGTVLVEQQVMSLERLLGRKPISCPRALPWVAQDGLSHYPASNEYLYATQRRMIVGPLNFIATRDPLTGKADEVCEDIT